MAFGARGRVDGWIAGGGCGGCGVVLVCGGGVVFCVFFFFNDTATTEIYTLSLHDALPILRHMRGDGGGQQAGARSIVRPLDRKSTRLNSSHT